MKKSEKIINSLLENPTMAGFNGMGFLPKSLNKLNKAGIQVNDNQQLRSIVGTYDNDRYVAFLIDSIDKKYWAIWKLYNHPKYENLSKARWSCFTEAKIGINFMKHLTFSELDKLTTQRLLQLLKHARKTILSGYSDDDVFGNSYTEEDEKYYKNIKLILSDREHLPRKRTDKTLNINGKFYKRCDHELKLITKKLKLSIDHPDVIEAFKNRIEELKDDLYAGIEFRRLSTSYKNILEGLKRMHKSKKKGKY